MKRPGTTLDAMEPEINMSTVSHTDLRKLLLHRLSEGEREQLEERLLTEEGFAERVQDEENDLLDDYAHGRLTPEDRAAVMQYVLIGEAQQRRAEFAQTLARLPRPPPVRAPKTRWLWAAPLGAVLAAGVAVVILFPVLRPGADSTSPGTGPTAPSPGFSVPPGAVPFTVTLLAETDRGAVQRTLRIGRDVREVRLQLETPSADAALTYQLSISDDQGRAVLTTERLSPHRAGAYPFVETVIPAQALGPGVHRLTLTPESGPRSAAETFTWQVLTSLD